MVSLQRLEHDAGLYITEEDKISFSDDGRKYSIGNVYMVTDKDEYKEFNV